MIICVMLAVRCAFAYPPEQIHLSFTENEGQMAVTWVSWTHNTSQVQYRPRSCDGVESTEPFKTSWSTAKKFFPGKRKFWAYYIHQAVMVEITKACVYEYQVGFEQDWSNLFQFSGRTPRSQAPFEDSDALTAWVFGDLGIGPEGERTLEFLQAATVLGTHQVSFHMGDIAYNMKHVEGGVGDQFLKMIQPFATQVPYMVGLGNHDRGGNRTDYKARFRMPVNEANEGTNLFYSINLGPAHFIMLDTSVFTKRDPEREHDQLQTQYNWLAADLQEASARRAEVPWIVVMTHVAMYCTPDWLNDPYGEFYECLREADGVKSYLEDLLFEHKVDIVLQGHVHNYERDTPIYKNHSYVSPEDTLNTYYDPAAPVFILSGIAGSPLGQNDPIPVTWAEYTRVLSSEYGVGQLQVFNKTDAHWQQFKSATGELVDSLWIIKRNG